MFERRSLSCYNPSINFKYTDRLALLDIKGKKVLLALSKNKNTWFIPGGKREKGETDKEALIREIKEELAVDVVPDSIAYFTTLEGNAHGKPKGTKVRIAYYTCKYIGNPKPDSEIERIEYFSFANAPQLAETGKLILNELKLKGLIE